MNKVDKSFRYGKRFEIGEFCVIGKNVDVGDNVKIGHSVVILDDCHIGSGTVVDHHVLLKAGTVIGERCFVDSYFHSSGVNIIGNDVTLRFNSCICRECIVEDGVFVSPNVMTIYGKHTGEEVGGMVIGKGSHIGTAAVLGPGVVIGESVVIGAMAYVNKDCESGGTYIGIPARRVR